MADTTQPSAQQAKNLSTELADGNHSAWMQELHEAFDREKGWRKTAATAVKLYEGEMQEQKPYNILYSNTETLSPALYNNVPRPVVKARFAQKENALTRLAALVAQRLLRYQLDTNDPDSTDFDTVMKDGVTKALVPGRGVMRLRYEAKFEAEAEAEPQGEAGEQEAAEPQEPAEKVSDESVQYDLVPWDGFLVGYAKDWRKVPWVAFSHSMSYEDIVKSFGEEVAGKVTFDGPSKDTDSGDTPQPEKLFGRKKADNDAKDSTPRAPVYEIWHRESRKVFFITNCYTDGMLKTAEDPLKLQSFWPMPKPLMLFRRVENLTPVVLYKLYEEQANELNELTVRITRIVKAMRVRGYYMGTVEGLGDLLNSDDNTMLPISNAAQMTGQGLKLDDAIWLMPIDKLVAVLQQLVLQREQVKSLIFEIMGIADIMRGSSQASETLGAQKLKDQWGSLRLRRMQKEVARYACEVMRITLEMQVTHLSPAKVKALTGLPFPTREEQAQMKQELVQMNLLIAQDPAQGQALGPKLAQLQQMLQAPTFDDILELLQQDQLRNFAISIETNSTVDAEATEDKADMAELMNALAQFLNGVAPLVENGTMPFEAAQTILVQLLQRFRMGGEVEEAILSIRPPSNNGQESEQLKQMQDALAKEQQKLQDERLKLDADRREFELSTKFAQRQLEQDKQFAIREIEQEKQFALQTVQTEKANAQKATQAHFAHAKGEHDLAVSAREESARQNIERMRAQTQSTTKES